jgi:hypothetical protein
MTVRNLECLRRRLKDELAAKQAELDTVLFEKDELQALFSVDTPKCFENQPVSSAGTDVPDSNPLPSGGSASPSHPLASETPVCGRWLTVHFDGLF